MLNLSTQRGDAWRTISRRDALRTAREIRAEVGSDVQTRVREYGSRYFIQIETADRLGWYVS